MMNKLNRFICVAAVFAMFSGCIAGCGKSDETSAAPTINEQEVITADGAVLPDKGSAGSAKYTIFEATEQKAFNRRGIYATVDDMTGDSDMLLFICAGEAAPGSTIWIKDIKLDGSTLIVTVEETKPENAAEGTIYPCCKVKLEDMGDDIKSLVVLSTEGEEFKYQDYSKDYEPEEGFVAVLHGGSGEQTYRTYVYKTDSGYCYVSVTATTVHWGATTSNLVPDDSGTVATKEEVLEIAKNHNSGSFVLFPGDNNVHTVEEFLKADF